MSYFTFSFLPCLPCLLMGSLFSSGGLPDGGVYPGVAVPFCRGFGRDSLLNDAQDCFLKVCPELIYGSAWCVVCCKAAAYSFKSYLMASTSALFQRNRFRRGCLALMIEPAW